MIKMQVIGHLGGDCTLNNVNGKNVINFSVAHTEKFKDNLGVVKESTTWVACSWWVERVAITDYLKKGQQVYVEGAPSVSTYTGQRNETVASLRLRVQSVQLLGAAKNNSTGNNNQQGTSVYNAPSDISEPVPDLPF